MIAGETSFPARKLSAPNLPNSGRMSETSQFEAQICDVQHLSITFYDMGDVDSDDRYKSVFPTTA